MTLCKIPIFISNDDFQSQLRDDLSILYEFILIYYNTVIYTLSSSQFQLKIF